MQVPDEGWENYSEGDDVRRGPDDSSSSSGGVWGSGLGES
jgi:hypothetical protein